MPKTRTEPPDLDTQAGRLVWARSSAGFSSPRRAALFYRWNENTYKSRETSQRREKGIPPDELEVYARLFGVDLLWLTFGKGRPFPEVTDEQLGSYPVRGTKVVNGKRLFDPLGGAPAKRRA